MFIIFLFFLIAAAHAEPENLDEELLSEIMGNAVQCATAGNIRFDLCAEMFEDDKDLSDSKYDSCKCMIPCVAKKMEVMTEDGKFDEAAIQKRMNDLKTVEYKKEAERVWPMCNSEPGVNCEGGFNAFRCGMKNSEIARNMAKKMLGALSGKS